MTPGSGSMRIVLANPRGFCAGVRMAIDVVDEVIGLFTGERVYVYHEIVHNKHVVGRFRERGVVFVESVGEVPAGSVLVFSAHGVSPAVKREADERGIRWIDATCPLVTKVHAEAIRYARKGYQILLVGHQDHQEVLGTRGEAPEATLVVERVEDIPGLAVKDPEKLVYLTQTTLSTDDAGVIIGALKRAFPKIHEPRSETICYATTNRQHAVRELAPMCDLVLVVGSKNSSNSVRLTEISRNAGTPARLIDDVGEIEAGWFAGGAGAGGLVRDAGAGFTVLITAGASAPEDLVAGICRELVGRFGARIEVADVHEETESFGLPATLRDAMREKGYDLGELSKRRIRVRPAEVREELYGARAVGLTVSARGGGQIVEGS